jgi:hypothetical protein
VTALMQRMREDLVRPNYAESTILSYLHTVEDFRHYVQKRLDRIGPDDIRRYQAYLREERKLDIGTVKVDAGHFIPLNRPNFVTKHLHDFFTKPLAA